MKIKFYKSIKFKFICIILILVIIPSFLIYAFYDKVIKTIFLEKYQDAALTSVIQSAEKIDYYLKDLEEFSNSILANRVFLDHLNADSVNPQMIQRDLQNFYASRDDIDTIQLVTDDNTYSVGLEKTMLYTSHRYGSLKEGIEWKPSKPYRVNIFSNDFISNYYSLARPIVDYVSLENYGDLYIDMDQQRLYDLYEQSQNVFDEIYIIDETGRILSHDYNTKIGTYVSYTPYGKDLIDSNLPNGQINYIDDDEDKVAFYSTFETNQWKLVQIVSTKNLFAEVYEAQNILLIAGLVYCIGIIIFLSIYFVRLTRPMERLVEDFHKVENGDLSVRTYIGTEDEIGKIGEGFNRMVYEMNQMIEKSVEEEKLKKQLELESLHAQINPHFLYNTLNTIKWMAKIQEAYSVSYAITSLVKLLRISINLGQDKLSLSKEVEYVQHYVAIQQLRFGDNIQVEFDIENRCKNALLPKLILQPIVENAILYNHSSDKIIHIKAYEKDRFLMIDITDNGQGIEEERIDDILNYQAEEKFSKVGLNNVNQRLKLYGNESCGLTINSEKGQGTTVIVKTLFENDERGI